MARLRLSESNKIIGGVCGGIAEHFGWDATILRILFVIAAFIGFGSPVIFYFVMWLIMKLS